MECCREWWDCMECCWEWCCRAISCPWSGIGLDAEKDTEGEPDQGLRAKTAPLRRKEWSHDSFDLKTEQGEALHMGAPSEFALLPLLPLPISFSSHYTISFSSTLLPIPYTFSSPHLIMPYPPHLTTPSSPPHYSLLYILLPISLLPPPHLTTPSSISSSPSHYSLLPTSLLPPLYPPPHLTTPSSPSHYPLLLMLHHLGLLTGRYDDDFEQEAGATMVGFRDIPLLRKSLEEDVIVQRVLSSACIEVLTPPPPQLC